LSVILFYIEFMNTSTPKAKRGRPPEDFAEGLSIRLRPSQLEAIDEWRREQRDLPSRAEAIRRLLDKALEGPR
jgi:hypothetical protein